MLRFKAELVELSLKPVLVNSTFLAELETSAASESNFIAVCNSPSGSLLLSNTYQFSPPWPNSLTNKNAGLNPVVMVNPEVAFPV